MAGFIRRYSYFPGNEIITQIEGGIIIDTPPPGSIQGTGSGTTSLIGEFADASFSTTVAADGTITASLVPVEVFSAQDMLNKVGGFDETIGEFGATLGNGFCAVRNRRFSRLILAPIDNVSPLAGTPVKGCRFWRQLPTNKSATDATPIVPVSGAVLPAGLEFKNAGHRVRIARRMVFGDAAAYDSGVDGAITNAGGVAAHQTFVAAGGAFVVHGAQVGDILVLGVIGGAGALGANADTYRVQAVTDATHLELEKLDGSTFDWTTGTTQPWRLHAASTADTSGIDGRHVSVTSDNGFTVQCRPLDQTVGAAAALAPTVTPSANAATSWNVLSGLTGAVSSVALTYAAAVHQPNVGASATLQARYQAVLDALMSDKEPQRDVNIVYVARKDTVTMNAVENHVLSASSRGLTRRGVLSPAVNQLTLATVIGTSAPGVGATRTDRLDYSWPACQHLVPEAVGFTLNTSNGKTTSDGVLDETMDGYLASVESNLPPERNPGQSGDPVTTVMSPILGFARGTPDLSMPEYIALRQAGVCGLRFDRVSGPIFQSGVTTSLVSGEKNISRRRMADFIEDSCIDALNAFTKQPLSQQLKDSAVGEVVAFLEQLKSSNNPSASRITDYSVDDKSGNTPASLALGIFVIIIRVQLTPTADFIVLQCDVGEGVVISTR